MPKYWWLLGMIFVGLLFAPKLARLTSRALDSRIQSIAGAIFPSLYTMARNAEIMQVTMRRADVRH